MPYADFPTHLGGAYKGLEWEQLPAYALVLSSCGSPAKALAVMALAKEQLDAAKWLDDTEEARLFEEAARALASAANILMPQHNDKQR